MRLPLPILISLSLWLLTAEAARAQSADDYFHGGAQFYISNSIPAAKEVVTNGLQRFPDDAKLKKLYDLLNQQQQQQQQNQQNQQNQKDQQKDQKQDQQKQDEKKQQEQQQSKNDQQKKEAKSAGSEQKDKPDEKKDEQQAAEARGVQPMTPQEARQLLDAQKGEEQLLQFKPGEKQNRGDKPVKDW
jgi:outer membrane biosynthesis protein TonB